MPAFDHALAGLVTDLEQRGLLDSTIVLWMGEFGRTFLSEGSDGRDHSRWGFSIWVAGAGVRGGISYGRTDDFGYNIVENPVSFFDLNATLLHLMGVQHLKLTFKHLGVDMRLSGLEREAEIVKGVLA